MTRSVDGNRNGNWAAERPLTGWMWLRSALRTVRWWWVIAQQRRALGRLDERQLRDMGVTRVDALQESLRWFWDVPSRQQPDCSAPQGARPPDTSWYTPRRRAA